MLQLCPHKNGQPGFEILQLPQVFPAQVLAELGAAFLDSGRQFSRLFLLEEFQFEGELVGCRERRATQQEQVHVFLAGLVLLTLLRNP